MAEECLSVYACVKAGCERLVEFDDDPWCDEHYPDVGSYFIGYSAEKVRANMTNIVFCECMFSEDEIGQCVCNRCHGDFYACECPVIHSILCDNHPEKRK